MARIITLSDDEIDCFNAYIEDGDMEVAFGNTDWNHIYSKIVGDRVSDFAKRMRDRDYDEY